MKSPPYYSAMHSGNDAIVLEEDVDYDRFSFCATRWAELLDLIITKRIDGPGQRIWECQRQGCRFWLAYDDWFPQISLEPQDAQSARIIHEIGGQLGIKG